MPGVPRRSLEMLRELLGVDGEAPRAMDSSVLPCAHRRSPGAAGPVDPAADGFDRTWELYWSALGLDPERSDPPYLTLLKPHFADAWRRAQAACGPLTRGQLRVLELVRDGHTNRQVARLLGLSEATVRTHLQNAYAALGVNNRVAAVAAAFGADDPEA